MKITLGQSGFCFGVKNAVDTVIKNAGENVGVLGELIHNRSVNEKLTESGIVTFERLEDVNTEKVIIRSHGEPPAAFEFFKDKNIEVIDCTCVFVKKIHKIVKEQAECGKQIIILGVPEHPEVVGINGWCNNSAIIISSEESVPALEKDIDYCIVVQTTFSVDLYNKIAEKIKNQPIKTVEFFNTICYTTTERQKEAAELARKNDVILVVGGKNSSNTRKLYEIAKQYCRCVYHIESVSDLASVKIRNQDSLAIIAGASTPSELIQEVMKHYERSGI